MEIREIGPKDKQKFNSVATHPLQSLEWGEFREQAGNKVVRLGVFKNKKLTDAVQVVFSKIPYTGFTIGTVIRGPKPTRQMLAAIKELGKKEKAIFIKLEPFITANSKINNSLISLLKGSGCIHGKTLFTPTSFWIDLTKSEEELLKSFHPKTRYNIRLAEKKGVQIVEDNTDTAFEKYLKLTQETVERQGFYAHTKRYHQLMWQILHQDMVAKKEFPIAHLMAAVYQKEVITTWILFTWQDFLYYPYGASSEKHKNVMANNLMMWEAIKFGKKLNLKTFDLWGREPGKGFTKFKEGYSPRVVEFIGTWDLITSPLYWFYRVAEFFRWSYLRGKTKLGLSKPIF